MSIRPLGRHWVLYVRGFPNKGYRDYHECIRVHLNRILWY